jgi:glyoxylase-like metal-dependent hydrolase (beta-lactamase superfamily II)
MTIITIDLNYLGIKCEIATYLIPYMGGVVLVDPGPEATLPVLIDALRARDLTPRDVTHVLITHIHLDHAGAAGWFAGQGAKVYVHPVGAPHLLNPEKLLASASRLYGDQMNTLWGEMKPVPFGSLIEVKDGMEIVAGELSIEALFTPGHAEHHLSFIYNDVIFSGDLGGIRYGPALFLRLPFVPPETELKKWRSSLERLKRKRCTQIAPTHFGMYSDANAHLTLAVHFLDDVEAWLQINMPVIHDVETLRVHYADFLHERAVAAGLEPSMMEKYERGGPTNFAAIGLLRYWQKLKDGT